MEISNSENGKPNEPALDTKSQLYIVRVNRAIDFILQNLDQQLNLELIAQAADFSPFHFHRIFKTLVGESLNEFTKRLRLERAIVLLSRTNWKTRQKQSLTDIALACGFSSSSDFSRCFKQRFGIPPSHFDVEVFRSQRREAWQSAVYETENRHLLDPLPAATNPDEFVVQLVEIPARTAAYIRVTDPYREGAVSGAAERMVQWAEKNNLDGEQWLGYMWDDPEVVAHQACRYDVGVVVPEPFESREVGWFDFPGMLVAQVEIRGTIDLEMRALDWLFRTWLPSSGFIPSALPAFEAWTGRPFELGMERFDLDVQIPIQKFHP
ncbi:MAG: GyrI-like domain-containing protein [Mariniblastus sp.]